MSETSLKDTDKVSVTEKGIGYLEGWRDAMKVTNRRVLRLKKEINKYKSQINKTIVREKYRRVRLCTHLNNKIGEIFEEKEIEATTK